MAVQIWIQSFNEKRVYLYANLITTNRKKIVERESKSRRKVRNILFRLPQGIEIWALVDSSSLSHFCCY